MKTSENKIILRLLKHYFCLYAPRFVFSLHLIKMSIKNLLLDIVNCYNKDLCCFINNAEVTLQIC